MSRSTPIVADVIAGDLARYGARRCFALLGTANFKISHALVQAGVELISARHECNAASMADAYASGELTLVSVHSGPGLTNALTGIGEAAKSRTPLVVLAGDVPSGAARGRRRAGAAAHARHCARRRVARRQSRAARTADCRTQPAARRAACAACVESAAARTAAERRQASSRSACGQSARRCIVTSAASTHSWRPRRGCLGRRGGARGVGGAHRRAVGDLGLRPWIVFRQSLVARHQRWLFLADRR
jgi:Thiamine pyrophosphate enzyme, N-terminal TPP binding domain